MVTETKQLTEQEIRQIVQDEIKSKLTEIMPALTDLIKSITSSVLADSKAHHQ